MLMLYRGGCAEIVLKISRSLIMIHIHTWHGLCTIVAHTWLRTSVMLKSGALVATGTCSDNEIALIETLGFVETGRNRSECLYNKTGGRFAALKSTIQ